MAINFKSQQVKNNLQLLAQAIPQAIEDGLKDLAEQAALKARTNTYYIPRGVDGLREATQAFSKSKFVTGVKADKFYAAWVDQGNGPAGSKIYPTHSNNLRFMIDGQVFYRRWVKASAPKPFFTEMVKWSKQEEANILTLHLNKALNRL